MFAAAAAWDEQETMNVEEISAFLLLVEARLRVRYRPRIAKPSLTGPELSAWNKLYNARQDGSFIRVTGFDVSTFDYLLEEFQNRFKFKRTLLGASGHLGLALHFLSSTCDIASLCLIFGVLENVVYKSLERALNVLEETLANLRDARVTWPTHAKMRRLADLVEARHPLMKGMFAFVDGLNLRIFNPGEPDKQNAHYNGWLKDVFCSCLFAFASDGTIIHATYNAPGSWHDQTLARNLFNILRDRQLTPDPFCVGADSGLHPNAVDCHLKMLTPMPDKDLHKMPLHTFVQTVLRHKQLVSSRQSAEWGMRIIQGCWSRLHLPLPVDNHKRQQILTCCIALHNLRTRRVGLNQIKTVYQDH